MNQKITEMQRENGEDKTLIFDSLFESGNLDMVYQQNALEYDLYMRVDTNTKGVQQWFYFSVEQPAFFQNKTVRFNVMNFTKPYSLHQHGMRIV